MTLRLIKYFNFSASYETKGRVIGHNYQLAVTLEYLPEEDEAVVTQKIQRDLIDTIHSRDFGQHVDFLKNKEITDALLLMEFSQIIRKAIAPAKLLELTLKRNDRSAVTMGMDV
jgi:hypothetical protein